MNFLRRLRGITAIATTWALGWAGIAAPIFFLLLPRLALGRRLLASLQMAAYAGLAGAIVGATTATLLVLFEHRATFAQLRARRIGFWGAIAGAACTTGLMLLATTGRIESPGITVAAAAVGALLGGASALLTLLVAREADRRSNPDQHRSAPHGPGVAPGETALLNEGSVGVYRPRRARDRDSDSRALAPAN